MSTAGASAGSSGSGAASGSSSGSSSSGRRNTESASRTDSPRETKPNPKMSKALSTSAKRLEKNDTGLVVRG